MIDSPAASLFTRRSRGLTKHAAWLTPALSLLCCLALWEAAVRWFQVPIYLVPPPSLIAGKLIAGYPLFLQETLHSVLAIITGFALAALVGVPAATLMIYSAWFRRSVYYLGAHPALRSDRLSHGPGTIAGLVELRAQRNTSYRGQSPEAGSRRGHAAIWIGISQAT